jgi:hypothetical protein
MNLRPRKIDLYFDSGAFSAWQRGRTIDLHRYMNFLHQYPDAAGAVNLDVIPGQPGKPRTRRDVEHAAEQSWANYITMREDGLDPMPVYHYGERRYWLEKMIGEGATYIGFGGAAALSDKDRRPWLDELFGYLCGSNGYPTVKVHGFGITTIDLIHRYPWFSTDSFSWMFPSAYGFAIMPRFDPQGVPDYTARPFWIGFSRGSTSGKVHIGHQKGTHYDVLGPGTKHHIDAYLEQQGFTTHDLHNHWTARARLTLRFYKQTIKAHSMPRFVCGRTGLFCQVKGSTLGQAIKPMWRYRVLFTENTSLDQSSLLHSEGIDDRLMSYGYFADAKRAPLDPGQYIQTGLIKGLPMRERLLT